MWVLTVRSHLDEPHEYPLKPGTTIIGRKSDSDIPLRDESASRRHAEILYDAQANTVVVRDLRSANGTFVNRERLSQPRLLSAGDQIRIGQHVISVCLEGAENHTLQRDAVQTQPFTRDLVLESLDHHAVLLYEVASRLNTIIDLNTALREVSRLMRVAMGADKCEVVLAERFDQLTAMGFPTSIARMAIDQRSAVIIPDMSTQPGNGVGRSVLLLGIRSAMCVPVMVGEEIAALIYVCKTRQQGWPFNQNDLQLAVAISHQAALTIQRTRLLVRIRKEQRLRQFLQRFLPMGEAETLSQEYLQRGHLPGLAEQNATVLFVDIRDSTHLAERLGARRFGEFLDGYYQGMTEIVFHFGGMLNKYLGDGVLAVFGAPQPQPEAEARAVSAALAMLDQMKCINQAEGEQIEVGIGINSGPCMVGYVGTEERAEFAVLGDIVNVANRLELLAGSNRVFIGPDTHQAIAGKFTIHPIGLVEVRGRTQPVEAFEVIRDHAAPPLTFIGPQVAVANEVWATSQSR
jgi:adenylate cyclase